MAETLSGKGDLTGFQSEGRTLEALPMRIDYQSPRYEHFMRQKGGDWLFSFASLKGQRDSGEIREATHLDPYAIRNDFEAVDDEKAAVRFLSEAGRFWIWEQVTWSQFREWQEFFKWLRLDPETAMRASEGKKAWNTARGFENQFFKTADKEFTRARFQGSDIPPEALMDNEKTDRARLIALRQFALDLGQNGVDSRVSLGWYSPKDGFSPEDWKEEAKAFQKGRTRSTERAPYLRLEARYILEAVAATIYADKAHGVKHGKCKKCGKIFEIKSDHGQQFCPVPDRMDIKTSPCKNAFFQHKRREAEKAKKKAEQAALKHCNARAKKLRSA